MKKEIYTEIAIAAPPAAVWRVLLDTPAYPDWNPFIVRLDGTLEPGTRPGVTIRLQADRCMNFKPVVIRRLENRELRWIGRTGFAGLFDGEHSLAIEPDDAGSLFVHREIFSGILLPFLWSRLKRRVAAGFEAMNVALKDRVESLAGGGSMETNKNS